MPTNKLYKTIYVNNDVRKRLLILKGKTDSRSMNSLINRLIISYVNTNDVQI